MRAGRQMPAQKTLPEIYDSAQLEVFKQKRKPGPPGADAIVGPELDLKNAALILELIDKGALHTLTPQQSPSTPHEHSRTHSRLSAEEEADLSRRVQIWGDIDARNTLVMANLGLVHLVANQFCRPPLRYEDLLQEGTMGLIRATETFEPSRNVRFSTYSVYWIRARIQRLIQKLEKDDIPQIPGAQSRTDAAGRKRQPRARKISMERTIEQEDSRSFGETLASDSEDPETFALRVERENTIKSVLSEIVTELGDDRLKTIIERRILADEPATLAEMGEALNLSREGARLLEARMLKLARQRLATWRYTH